MRYIKASGLAACAVMVVMAFAGTGVASAQHKITLCKQLVTLCPNGALWPAGTDVAFLAAGPKLHLPGMAATTCPDAILFGETETSVGSPLKLVNRLVEYGTLPTPKLGLGCTGPCFPSGKDENLHLTLDSLQFEVEAVDKYFLQFSGLVLLLNCPFLGTCVYRAENVKAPITHTGKHALDVNAANLPLANVVVTLTRQTTHGGSAFCPVTAEWLADFVLPLVEDPAGNVGLAWPSLDLP